METSEIKIQVTETSRATYTSYRPSETNLGSLLSGGWKISKEEITDLLNGKIICLYSPNGMRRLNITKLD